MKYLIKFFKQLHKDIDPEFSMSPFMSVSLLMIYSIILGVFGYLVGIDLFSREVSPVTHLFQELLVRSIIVLFFINFNVVILYFLIRLFRQKRLPIKTIYSYYAIFGTLIFTIAIILFFSVMGGYYLLGIPLYILLMMFGVSIIIILTLINLYPAVLLFLSLKHEPIDVFWPIILCVLIIHLMSFALFRMWNAVDILMLWIP